MESVKSIEKTEAMVERLLEENIATRNSDYYLFAVICTNIMQRPPSQISLLEVATNIKLPKYETVTRARRKVQERRPELCSERAKAARAKQERVFKEYSQN